MTYLTTPNYYAAPGAKAKLRNFLIGARNPSRSRAVRWVRLGDSQATSPGGSAAFIDPYIAYFLWQRYGNIPESQAVQMSNIGGGSPVAAIGMRETLNAAVAAGDCPTARFVYNQEPGGNNRFDNSTPTTGACYTLQANMLDISGSLTDIPRNIEYISRTGLTFLQLIPHLATQGPTIAWRNSFSSTGAAMYFTSNTATGSTDISAAQVADYDWEEIAVPFTFGADPPTAANLSTHYPQHIEVSATAAQVEPGPAWWASGNKSGVAYTSWGKGSKKMGDFLVERPDWQLFARAYDPNIVGIQFGANDAGVTSAAQYEIDAGDLVDAIIHELPDAVIPLVPCTPRTGMSAGEQAVFDLYADALLAVARAYPNNCVFINVQRMMTDGYGWTNANALSAGFTTDGVHDSVMGAKIKATAHVSGLFRAAGLEGAESSRGRPTRGRIPR